MKCGEEDITNNKVLLCFLSPSVPAEGKVWSKSDWKPLCACTQHISFSVPNLYSSAYKTPAPCVYSVNLISSFKKHPSIEMVFLECRKYKILRPCFLLTRTYSLLKWYLTRHLRSRILLEKVIVRPAKKDTSRFLCVTNVHYQFQKSPLTAHTLNNINTIHTFKPCFTKIHLNIILPSTPISSKWAFHFRLSKVVRTFHLPRTCYIPHQSHHP